MAAGGRVAVLRYALFDLLATIDLLIIAGVLAAAFVTVVRPTGYLAGLGWTQGIAGTLMVLAISVPPSVCTTGSVPIAASPIAAGMTAGTALVFLVAGPATNVATLGAVYRTQGGRVLALYLGTVAFMSISLGLLFDSLLSGVRPTDDLQPHGVDWIGTPAAIAVTVLLTYLVLRRVGAVPDERRTRAADEQGVTPKVEGMSCQHCVASVKRSLEGLEAVDEASPNLVSGLVRVRRDRLDASELVRAVEQAGFQVSGTRDA